MTNPSVPSYFDFCPVCRRGPGRPHTTRCVYTIVERQRTTIDALLAEASDMRQKIARASMVLDMASFQGYVREALRILRGEEEK